MTWVANYQIYGPTLCTCFLLKTKRSQKRKGSKFSTAWCHKTTLLGVATKVWWETVMYRSSRVRERSKASSEYDRQPWSFPRSGQGLIDFSRMNAVSSKTSRKMVATSNQKRPPPKLILIIQTMSSGVWTHLSQALRPILRNTVQN